LPLIVNENIQNRGDDKMIKHALSGIAVAALLAIASQASAAEPPGMDVARAAKARHADSLFQIDGVVGVGTSARGGDAVVLVLVENGDVRGIPSSLDGTPVVVRVTGKIHAISHKGNHPDKPGGGGGGGGGDDGGGDEVDTTVRFDRPIPIGVSVGNEGECSSGTVGARLTDGVNAYGLSNNHVWALENAADIGVDAALDDTATDTVLKPGRFDTACSTDSADKIGVLYDFVPIEFTTSATNEVDAAIALMDSGTLDCSTPIDGYGMPLSTTGTVQVGDPVKKYGRTTQLTTGTVASTDIEVNVGYTSGLARFVDQILIDGDKGGVLNSGDSGSLLVAADNTPTGLLYASGRGGKLAFANHIDVVLAQLIVPLSFDDCAP
jgi:hypothetical protein